MRWRTMLNLIYWHVPRVEWVNPFGMQEPMLEPRLPAILANIKQMKPPVQTSINSNMSVYPEAAWRRIMQSVLLDAVNVSFYGVDRDVYNAIQPPLDFDTTVANIKRLIDTRNRLGWHKPRVAMKLLMVKETYKGASIKRWLKRWRGVVDEIGLVWYDGWHGRLPWDEQWETKLWGPSAEERVPCHRLWQTMNVRSDGTLVPCCIDHDLTYPCGSVDDDPYLWWDSPALNALRTLHLQRRFDEIPLCKECTIWRRETPPAWKGWISLNAPAPVADLPTA